MFFCIFSKQSFATFTVTLTASNYNGTNISCFGLQDGSITANPTGGAAPYTFLWSNQETGQTITGLAAGYYRVQVKDNAGAIVYAEVTLTQPEALVLEALPYTYPNSYNISCYSCANGIIDVYAYSGTPTYTFLWSDGNTNQSRSALSPGTYAVTATDVNGCSNRSEGIYLTEPARSDWTILGNAGSNAATNFIGTTDNTDLIFKTNNAERLKIKANGELKIGSMVNTGLKLVYADSLGVLKQLPIGLPPPYNACIHPYTMPWWLGSDPTGVEVINCWQRFGFGTEHPRDLIEVAGNLRVTNYQNTNKFMKISHNGSQGLIDATEPLWLNNSGQDVYIGNNMNNKCIVNSMLGIGTGNAWSNARVVVSTQYSNSTNSTNSTIGLLCQTDASNTRAIVVNDLNSTENNFSVYGNGQVFAREVTVKTGTFPDYVFAKEYKILPLDALHDYINANKHLPEMPTATEVEKNGQSLGQVQTLLVKKVEELTLYLIEQNYRIKQLEANNKQLARQLQQINTTK